MANHKYWTPEKLRELSALRERHTVEEISSMLGLSRRTLYSVIRRYNLPAVKPGGAHSRMTDETARWLKKNYPHISDSACSALLGIYVSTVKDYASRLMLKKTPEYLAEEASYRSRRMWETRKKNLNGQEKRGI